MNWVQKDEIEGREGDPKRKFQEEETNSVKSSEREHCVQSGGNVSVGEHSVYGSEGRGMACDKNGEVHPKQAGH